MDFLLSPLVFKSFLILREPISEMNAQRGSFAIIRHFSNPQKVRRQVECFIVQRVFCTLKKYLSIESVLPLESVPERSILYSPSSSRAVGSCKITRVSETPF